jgi:hypothetical protein
MIPEVFLIARERSMKYSNEAAARGKDEGGRMKDEPDGLMPVAADFRRFPVFAIGE